MNIQPSNPDDLDRPYDVAVIGAGAAGLMAAIFAARSGARTIALDGATKIGAKILISGGGRCNVTHDVVTPSDFNGNRNAIAKVLRTFDVPETIAFFESLHVELRREGTGKLFPATGRARTVLDALIGAAVAAGAVIRSGCRVEGLKAFDGSAAAEVPARRVRAPRARRPSARFLLRTEQGSIPAQHVILATGGRSVPKTGSDGFGYDLARAHGHSVEEPFPALVPLIVPAEHWLTALRGASVDTALSVRSGNGRVLHRERGSMLFTHFGLSGPVVLDISRHWVTARRDGLDGASVQLVANLLPDETFESIESHLLEEGRRNSSATIASSFRGRIAGRVAAAVVRSVNLDETAALVNLTKEDRRSLVRAVVELPLPVVRDRGFEYAEVTAGGVPLAEVEVRTMESRLCPGVYLCGEILDVDGKIGGFNFQWAWASGRLAGMSAAAREASGE